MSVNLDDLEGLGEADDWLRCPDCVSYDCRVQQDPEYVHFLFEGFDMYTHFKIARWS